MPVNQVDNPEISSNFQKGKRQAKVAAIEGLSITERLMQRTHDQTFFVPIDEGLEIEVYTPTDGEYMELLRLQGSMLKIGTRLGREGVKDFDQAIGAIDEISSGWDRLHQLVAKLCVDPSLDFEFFRAGHISAADKQLIISGIIKQVQGEQEKTVNFRPE